MSDLTQKLLDWYDLNGRKMPWRFKGAAPDIYPVWISEIMLQQTTVGTVVDYFLRWMKRFPSLESLANSNIDDVLHMWQGLGYYTRAKKIHECAKVLMEKYAGKFPENRNELLKLPGIGVYTASSICAFGFNLPETVVDGNVIRVVARLYGLIQEVDKDIIYPLAEKLTSKERGADYASAIMDLGATVCKPQNPLCLDCPWHDACVAFQKGLQEQIPLIKKPMKRKAKGAVFLGYDAKKRLFLTKRDKGLLSGLFEFPWSIDGFNPPFEADWQKTEKSVHHVFTHIDFVGDIYVAYDIKMDGLFVELSDFKNYPVSTLMKKVIKIALTG